MNKVQFELLKADSSGNAEFCVTDLLINGVDRNETLIYGYDTSGNIIHVYLSNNSIEAIKYSSNPDDAVLIVHRVIGGSISYRDLESWIPDGRTYPEFTPISLATFVKSIGIDWAFANFGGTNGVAPKRVTDFISAICFR